MQLMGGGGGGGQLKILNVFSQNVSCTSGNADVRMWLERLLRRCLRRLTKPSGGAFFACVRRSSPFFEKRVVSRVQVKEFTLGGQNLK